MPEVSDFTGSVGEPAPGPWRVVGSPREGVDVEDASGKCVCIPLNCDGKFAANARLIAAAPSLLAFAEMFVATFQPVPFDPANDRFVKAARAAIALATKATP